MSKQPLRAAWAYGTENFSNYSGIERENGSVEVKIPVAWSPVIGGENQDVH